MLNIRQIMEILPHRYPFLLVDRIVELEPGVSAVGIKNITANEPQFTGHWPENPVMPGVLIVEAMAQVGGIMLLTVEENRDFLAVFAGVDEVRFRRQVEPGDQLRIEAELVRSKGRIGKAKAVATVDGEVVASGILMFALTDKPSSSTDPED